MYNCVVQAMLKIGLPERRRDNVREDWVRRARSRIPLLSCHQTKRYLLFVQWNGGPCTTEHNGRERQGWSRSCCFRKASIYPTKTSRFILGCCSRHKSASLL